MGLKLGIDIGSTTVKLVVLKGNEIIYSKYERHLSKPRAKTIEMLTNLRANLGNQEFTVAFTGSAAFGLAKKSGIEFIQEVYASRKASGNILPLADVIIELGGEDAKIIYLTGELEERMNGSCAGGTGSFIDQMALLLDVTPEKLDQLSLESQKDHTIASRCGVFAKTDIQSLLNQGAQKSDIAASIFQAVADQTITGLAQGREIKGKVMFLGGPLFFYKGLQKQFIKTLKLDSDSAIFPETALFAMAGGAAFSSCKSKIELELLIDSIINVKEEIASRHLSPLFETDKEYTEFKNRHAKADLEKADISTYEGRAYLGIDCGSTTTKLVLINEHHQILFQYYGPNKGNPVQTVKDQLEKIYELCQDKIQIYASGVTGYGEDIIKEGFSVDFGMVETIAHFKAAKYFREDVDFIIDIGGQDMKCFKIKDGVIDNILLNEACSSGCGSFIETFGKAMGYTVEEFANLAIQGDSPIDLGSRCTVFMNSSVKQAQKEGASPANISAGLCVSVIKNAVYKVIRANSPKELGNSIVVQGGTFLNDGVLRAFEKELGIEVTRPEIAGIMGALGAALFAKEKAKEQGNLISLKQLKEFTHKQVSTRCKLCTNHCQLGINTFGDNTKKYISGNKCEKPLGKINNDLPDLYEFKINLLNQIIQKDKQEDNLILSPTFENRAKLFLKDQAGFWNLSKSVEKSNKVPTLGIPRVLNLIELMPFWLNFFRNLGIEPIVSDFSSRNQYRKGQSSIPSDTACYPAKLVHGHVEELIEQGADVIFYPCMSYNLDEKKGDNNFNCPVVAYYPEVLSANMQSLKNIILLKPYIDLNNKEKLAKELKKSLAEIYPHISKKNILSALEQGYIALEESKIKIQKEGERALEYAKLHNLPVAVLAGRPYHIDPEINHGINKMVTSLGMVVVSEDAIAHLENTPKVQVLDQWTYHSRMYSAGELVAKNSQAELVQLVSFGCGIDAITTDEIKENLKSQNKIYTQLKIDEINNLGSAKIRLRSLLAAREGSDENI